MKKPRLKLKDLLPLIYIIPAAAAFFFITLDFFRPHDFIRLFNSDTLFILRSTFLQAAASSLFCLIFSIGPVMFIRANRRRNFLSVLIRFTFFIPYYYPVVSTVISFSIILTGHLLGFRYTLFSIIAAHVFYNTPVMVKYLSASIVKINPEIHENAVLETSSFLKVLRYVSIPAVSKSFFRAFFLVFCFCFTSFGVILALGNVKYSNFEISIFTSLNTSMDFSTALGYGLIQFAILAFINYFASKPDSYELQSEHFPDSDSWRLPETFLSAVYVVFEILIIAVPAAYFIYFSKIHNTDYFGIIFSQEFNSDFPVINSFLNSVILSFMTSSCVTFLTFIILKKNSRYTEVVITSMFAVSTALLSVAFLYLSVISGIKPLLLMLAGFITVTMPYSYSFLHQHVTGLNREMIEASMLETKSAARRFFRIELPVIFPALTVNMLNIFAISYGEFTFAYVFNAGSSWPLMSTVNFSIASRRMLGETYALNTFNMLFIIILFGIIFMLSRGKLTKMKLTGVPDRKISFSSSDEAHNSGTAP